MRRGIEISMLVGIMSLFGCAEGHRPCGIYSEKTENKMTQDDPRELARKEFRDTGFAYMVVINSNKHYDIPLSENEDGNVKILSSQGIKKARLVSDDKLFHERRSRLKDNDLFLGKFDSPCFNIDEYEFAKIYNDEMIIALRESGGVVKEK